MDSSTRFRRLEALFDELTALDPDAQSARLAAVRGQEPELADELAGLLAAHAGDGTDQTLRAALAEAAVDVLEPDAAGREFGAWRVLGSLGAGGMGTVYLAERSDGAYEARAAVKLVRGGLPSPALRERFRQERQILADLSHPGIARLLDGGSADDGTPFIVMEYVEGTPLTEWCDARGASLAERIELLLQVCEAVSHAHRRLVVHRDLKPGNILVTPDGQIKLLDFGIATLADAVEPGDGGDAEPPDPAAPATAAVTLGGRYLTPAYASPEQAAGRRVGVEADVYALGVILYQLATGRLPIPMDGLTPGEAIEAITTGRPPPPSTVAEDPARRRRLAGDLDAILARALEKDPAARYPSVEALAEDLRRHLERRPVSVLDEAWSYRAGKFVRRHAGSVAAGALVLVLVLTFGVSSYLQARALARERDRAEAQRATAERATEFLAELFTQADPNETPTLDVTAREMLDRGASRLGADLADEPRVQAALATVMGRVYRRLGEYAAAGPLLDQAVALGRGARAGSLGLAESLTERGALAYDQGDYEGALAFHREALATARAAPGDPASLEATLLDWRAASLSALGRDEEAEAAARRYLELVEALHDPPHAELAVAHLSLADILRDRGALEESLTHAQAALGQRRALYPGPHLDVAHSLNHVTSSLLALDRAGEALPYVEEGLAMRRQIFPGGHAEVAASLGNQARVLAALERFEEAEAARRESVLMLREIFGETHPYVAASTFSLGNLLLEMGEREEAMSQLRESVRLSRAAMGPAHPNVGYPLTALGRAHLQEGDAGAAEKLLREAWELRREGLGPEHWHVAASGLELGRALDQLGRPAEAEALLLASHEILTTVFGPGDRRAAEAREALADHYRARGLGERARELLREQDQGSAP